MTREEFEEKRDNFNSQRNDYLEKQNERDIVYKQKVKAGNASGLDKFLHVLGSIVKSMSDSMADRVNKM